MSYSASFFADGAPAVPVPPPAPAVSRRSARMASEGPRGLSVRATVFLRYIAYMLTIGACSAFTHYCFAASTSWRTGGVWMFISATVMFATAALATLAYANQRNFIVEQLRHYVFGLTVFPGVGLSVFMLASRGLTATAQANGDAFLTLLGSALPIVFFCTVLIPPAVFIKTMAGMRTLQRATLDDEEMMRLWTRQDGHQR